MQVVIQEALKITMRTSAIEAMEGLSNWHQTFLRAPPL